MRQKKLVEGFAWMILTILILVLFSSRTSPVYSLLYGDYTGNNASHAMLIGKYWLEGMIPYKDLYSVGGPIYFAIQAVGWFLGGRIGIFCLQILNLVLYFYFIKKTLLLFVKNKWAIIYTIFSLIPYIALCSGGNSPEEWSLSILAVILWLIFSECAEHSLSNFKLFILGIFSGILLFLQWQALGVATAGIVCFVTWIVKKKEYKKLGFLILGFIIPILILVGYFYKMNCLHEMLDYTFTYSMKMQLDAAFESTAVILHKLVKCCFCVPLFLVGVYHCKKGTIMLGFTSILISVCCMCSFMCNDNGWVHFLIVMPMISLAFALLDVTNKKKYLLNACVGVCYIALCMIPLKAYGNYLIEGIQDGTSQFYEDFTSYVENYPDNRWIMIDTDSSYLLKSDKKPVTKYFAMQTELAKYDETVKSELEKYVSEDWGADILISSEHRWGHWNSDAYTLTQVYIKYRGNISIYIPNEMEEEAHEHE